MRIVICGTRQCKDVCATVNAAWDASPWARVTSNPVSIIAGGGGDVDKEAEFFAARRLWEFTEVAAQWKDYGNAAGPIRNGRMVEMCDAVIAVWDSKSRGTLNMIMQSVDAGRPVFIYPINKRREA